MIPRDRLYVGGIYEGVCRNADYAQWTGHKFVYVRHKMGQQFAEAIKYPTDETDPRLDVFEPWRLLPLNADILELI